MKVKNANYKLWAMPVLLALITLAGLVFAIMGTGFWHLFSWLLLCYPILIMLKYGRKFFAKGDVSKGCYYKAIDR